MSNFEGRMRATECGVDWDVIESKLQNGQLSFNEIVCVKDIFNILIMAGEWLTTSERVFLAMELGHMLGQGGMGYASVK